MGKADYLKLGDWNAICDRCGAKFKGSALRKTWQGYMVCEKDWEPRHPQDFVRGLNDPLPIPWARPKGEPGFIPFCTPCGITAFPDTAVADCAIADYIHYAYDADLCGPQCSVAGKSALPDVAVASCAITDYISPSYDPSIT